MIIGCIEVAMRSAEVTGRRIVGVKDINNAVAIGIVVGDITIIGNVSCSWTSLNGVGNKVVVAVEIQIILNAVTIIVDCLLYTSPSPRDKRQSRMPSSA